VEPRTFHASRGRLVVLLSTLVLLPLVGFWISYSWIAPARLGEDVRQLKETTKTARENESFFKAQYDVLVEDNEKLRADLQEVRSLLAEMDAKFTMAETARLEAADEASGMEEELLNLRSSVKFYEQFMKPANQQAPLQCFNMTLRLSNGYLTYAMTFMKNDRKDTRKLSVDVAFRVLAGASAIELDPHEAAVGAPVHERRITLTKDYRLTGKFKVKSQAEGIRLLDVKAYDEKNTVVAQCWKSF
jgi:hypothetical protein